MTTDEQLTMTAPLSNRSAVYQAAAADSVETIGARPAPSAGARCAPESKLRRAPFRSLVLSQSWVPFSVSPRERSAMRPSTLTAAEAFTLLSSELDSRRGGAKPPAA